jgi:hypothetical protein
MYKVDMYITIKTLLAAGKSQRSIAKELGISARRPAGKLLKGSKLR